MAGLSPIVRQALQFDGFSAAHLAYINGDWLSARDLWDQARNQHDLLGRSLLHMLFPDSSLMIPASSCNDHEAVSRIFDGHVLTPLVARTDYSNTQQSRTQLRPSTGNDVNAAEHLSRWPLDMDENVTGAIQDIDHIQPPDLQIVASRAIHSLDFHHGRQ